MTRTALNVIVFQAGWLACVLGAAHGFPWIGLAAAVAGITLHLGLAARPAAELQLIALALGVGAVLDTLLLATGWVRYPSGMVAPYFAPYWILAMWALFATTLNVSLAWIKRSLPLAAVLGACCGPMSYIAGERLGGIVLIEPIESLVLLAAGWVAAMPVLALAARRLNGIETLATASPVDLLSQD